MQEIFTAYQKHKSSEIYLNYERNQKIFSGKSSDVFYNDVLRRVKLEYMGVLNDKNQLFNDKATKTLLIIIQYEEKISKYIIFAFII